MKFDPAETLRLGQFLLDRQMHLGPNRAATWDKDSWDDYQAAAQRLKLMHERIAELEAQLAAAKATAPIPSNSAELEPSTPWYPDDSGEWVEVPEDLMKMPDGLVGDEQIQVLTLGERRERIKTARVDLYSDCLSWDAHTEAYRRIVAYKVVKP